MPVFPSSRRVLSALCSQSLLSCSHAAAGTNRALLCKSTVDGLQVTQLNMDHTTENEDELFRLSQLGERGGDNAGRGGEGGVSTPLARPLPSAGGRGEGGMEWMGCDLGAWDQLARG